MRIVSQVASLDDVSSVNGKVYHRMMSASRSSALARTSAIAKYFISAIVDAASVSLRKPNDTIHVWDADMLDLGIMSEFEALRQCGE